MGSALSAMPRRLRRMRRTDEEPDEEGGCCLLLLKVHVQVMRHSTVLAVHAPAYMLTTDVISHGCSYHRGIR
jgi:hypothetical protein